MTQGNGGWYRVAGADLGLPGVVYLRIGEVDGRDRVTELYLDGRGEPLTARAVRGLPTAAFESGAGQFTDTRSRHDSAGPDLSRLARFFGTTFHFHGRKCDECGGPLKESAHAEHTHALTSWPALAYLAQIPKSGIAQTPFPAEALPVDDDDARELRLDPPGDDGLTDEFLTQVGEAYALAVQRRMPPAVTLGKLAHTSPRTVHRWVYTARRRGLMPSATSTGRIV